MSSAAVFNETHTGKEEDNLTIYEEKTLGKTLFRVTSVFSDKIDLKQTLEDSIVKRILSEIKAGSLLHESA